MSNPDGAPASSGTGLASAALKEQMSRLQKALASNTKGKGGGASVASVRGPGMMGLASVSVADVGDVKEETNGRSRRKKGSRRDRDPNPWHLHKFGGTSMAKMQDVAAVVKRVLTEFVPGRTGVVVSAMAGVTNALYKALETARQQDNAYVKVFDEVITRHKDTARALLPPAKAEEFAAVIDKDADALQKILSTTWYGRVCSVEHSNLFVGFGELWSSLLLTLYLQSRPDEFPHAERIDAREIVVLQKRQVTNVDGIPRIDFEKSGLQMAAWLKAHPACQIAVITGFVCQTHDGIYSILGRNGSDFSCTIFGALLNSVKVTIWKDVEGVYTADPRFVPDAMKVDAMSYEEAIELSNFGGQVMHPLTMLPIMEKHIPVSIRSTFLPDSSGTVISRGHSRGMGLVKCFSNIDNLALVRVSSPSFSMETVEHLVVALARALVNVVQVGQSPFEHACQLIVYQRDAEVARETIERALNRGESAGDIQVAVVAPVSIVAAIGDGIVTHQRTSAKFFSALYKAHVSVHAIAQSVSERSVCVVVDQPLAKRAVQALHAAFLQPLRTVAIGIMGPSVIASELCWQLAAQQRHLRETRGVNLQVRALLHVDVNTVPDPSAHLRQMHQNNQRRNRQSQRDGSDTETDEEDDFGFGSAANAPDMSAARLKMVKIPPIGVLEAAEWDGLLAKGVTATFDDFAKHVLEGHALHTVVVDCTTEPLGTLYGPWLSAGIDVITCNQRAVTLPHILSSLRRWEEGHLTKCMYDTCVGAGFTVVSTIRDLQLTGDSVIECDGVLSVTLSFVFNTFSPLWGSKEQPRPKFSEVVGEAIKRKYVEQDMRDDFDGQYMARKLLILADASGLSITLDDIEVQSLVPASHSIAARPKATNAEVLAAMAANDAVMDDMLKQAEAKGEVLRYVGSFSLKTKKACVGIRSFPKTHPFASAQFTDQMLLLTTDRYSERPLLMVGPGETTVNCAASLLGDTIRLASLVADAQM